MTKIFVVDTETTGLTGYPSDLVLEVGVMSYDTESHAINQEYGAVIGYDTSEWPKKWTDCWAYNNTSLSLDKTNDGVPFKEVRDTVCNLLKGNYATSYNRKFDFNQFLDHEPWSVQCLKAPCIMLSFGSAYPDLCSYNHHAQACSQEIAYNATFPDDPLNLSVQTHRAVDDATVAAWLLRHLHENHKIELP
ncbi:MAG: hypothetical protein E7Z63_06110 [Thermoplasmata archaeon]|nr:hypothetical protein [Thermoplasmata archaeon]